MRLDQSENYQAGRLFTSVNDPHPSDARLKAIFDTAAVGIGILGMDRKIIDANPAMCRMLGWSHEELIGQTPELAVLPEDYPQSQSDYEELLHGKTEFIRGERRILRKNGEVFWAHVTLSVVHSANDRLSYLIGMLIDIDEQKRLWEGLRESETRIRAIFDNTTVGIALTTLSRQVIQVNEAAARITGYSVDELCRLNPVELAVLEDRKIGQAELEEMIAGRRDNVVVERRFIRKNGEVFWARLTYSLVRDQVGNPQYLIGLVEDINQEKLASQRLFEQELESRRLLEQRVAERTSELAQANQKLMEEIEQRKRIERVLSTKAAEEAVSAERTRLARELHDAVTQTLFSASLIAEILPELWQMDAEEARKTTDELRQLTRGALAEMRTLLLELRPTALLQSRFEDLLKQLTEAVIGRARLPVVLHVEGDRKLPPEVQVALYRIAQESLNNIVKYAKANQISINLVLLPSQVFLQIEDNGIGFNPKEVKPTSLGMRIMRERAESIDAQFQVTSIPGKGTTITVIWVPEESTTVDDSLSISP
jgi:PAS domain S-box-containing protein